MGASELRATETGVRTGSADICVLGLGSVLWTDDGFGIRCVETLQQRFQFSAQVRLIEAASRRLHLLPHVRQARKLLIFDTIDYGLRPGTLRVVENDEVPLFMVARKLSRRSGGFEEVLQLARCLDEYNKHVVLIGCQPEENGIIGMSLRPSVKHALRDAIAFGVQVLQSWNGMPRFIGEQTEQRG